MRQLFLYIFLAATLMTTACKKPQQLASVIEDKNLIKFETLDLKSGQEHIIRDVKEKYFENVRPLEMCIQMGETWNPEETRTEILARFIKFTQEDVAPFSEKDLVLIQRVEDSISVLFHKVDKKWIVPEIYLVKLNAQCYGEGVFYTRDNGIFIPYDQLNDSDFDALVSVFLHEIYHIMSRYHESFRRASYSLIGYQALEGQLSIPKALDQRIFLNPDGVNMRYAIELSDMNDDTKKLNAISVIHSNKPNYTSTAPSFFGYIQFDLFQVEESNGGYKVLIGGEENQVVIPEIGDNFYPSFFSQIYDNTQYIIHPDEIMADNFMFAIFDGNNKKTSEFSENGRRLLDDFQNLIFGEKE